MSGKDPFQILADEITLIRGDVERLQRTSLNKDEANSGKPKGARHKTTLEVEALLEGQAEALTQAAIAKALEGDTVALRLCLDRIAPARKDAPVRFDLPEMSSAAEAARASQGVLAAVASGEVTPVEGAGVMGLIETYRKTLETVELEARILALEGAK